VDDVEYRTLGRSGCAVSTLTLGTMTFGNETDEDGAHAQLDRFLDVGGTLIDTADVYTAGASEVIIGRWLAKQPEEIRERVVLATKGRFPMGEGPNGLGLSRRHLADALDASLRRLGVDTVDLYQLHAHDSWTPIEETLRFLDDAVSAGKIHYVGLSNFLGYQLQRAVDVAEQRGWSVPVTLQPQYNLLVREIEWEIVPAAQANGLGLLPWSPLGGGWLTGKYRRDEQPTGDTRLGDDPDRGREAYGPAVTSVILGARTLEQLEDNLGAAGLHLTAEETARLDAASDPAPADYPYGGPGVEQRGRKIEGGR
jgi:aryl-alcohol dehydrogenase-like predicted oxidoreductase